MGAGEDLRFRIVTLEVGIDDRDHAVAWPVRTCVSKMWETGKLSRDGEPWQLDMLSLFIYPYTEFGDF